MPKLIRFYIRQCIIGFVVAAVFVAALIWLDVGHLRHLVTHTSAGPLAVFLLWMLNGIVFAGAQFGIAITGLARTDPGSDSGLKPPLVLARVTAAKRKDHRISAK